MAMAMLMGIRIIMRARLLWAFTFTLAVSFRGRGAPAVGAFPTGSAT